MYLLLVPVNHTVSLLHFFSVSLFGESFIEGLLDVGLPGDCIDIWKRMHPPGWA